MAPGLAISCSAIERVAGLPVAELPVARLPSCRDSSRQPGTLATRQPDGNPILQRRPQHEPEHDPRDPEHRERRAPAVSQPDRRRRRRPADDADVDAGLVQRQRPRAVSP